MATRRVSAEVRAARAAVLARAEAQAAEFVVVPVFSTLLGWNPNLVPSNPPALSAETGLPVPDDGPHTSAAAEPEPVVFQLDPVTKQPKRRGPTR